MEYPVPYDHTRVSGGWGVFVIKPKELNYIYTVFGKPAPQYTVHAVHKGQPYLVNRDYTNGM